MENWCNYTDKENPEVLGENAVSRKVLNPMYISYKIMTFLNKWVDYARSRRKVTENKNFHAQSHS